MTQFAYIPLTEEEADEMTGLAPIRAMVAAGDPIASLLLERIAAAEVAMAPEIARMKAEIEREWMEGSSTCPDGLALLLPK